METVEVLEGLKKLADHPDRWIAGVAEQAIERIRELRDQLIEREADHADD